MKVLVTGAQGMVGRALTAHCNYRRDEWFAYDHAALDITSYRAVESEIKKVAPDAVINCAAWTDVDGCERDPARAEAVNSAGPENLARATQNTNAAFVTISTDYVFDGSKDGFYTQEDEPRPQSVYGKSKLEGERRAQLANPQTIVVRSGFIFGPAGRNFLSTMAHPLLSGKKIKVIADAWGTPTFSGDLAGRLLDLAQLNLPGIYHVVNGGEGASFEDFARELVKFLGVNQSQVEAVLSASLNRPAPRPRNSRLKCLFSEKVGLSPLREWREAIPRFLFESVW